LKELTDKKKVSDKAVLEFQTVFAENCEETSGKSYNFVFAG